MIELTPPKKEKGAVGRHRTKGDRVRLDDFELVPVPETIYCVGVRMVKAKIFGYKTVTAIVTRLLEFEWSKPRFLAIKPSQPL